ncbi:hypothetical protein JOB18_030648 [Solea senegalensis]|uniref:Uncharacterized protein n=1 Tax=Solea senegalensis TaxID=28829 RepID=A0AAV6RP92_SOLSE|nr:hypothetical protein JOB18_030648 [Solea senegalensis]
MRSVWVIGQYRSVSVEYLSVSVEVSVSIGQYHQPVSVSVGQYLSVSSHARSSIGPYHQYRSVSVSICQYRSVSVCIDAIGKKGQQRTYLPRKLKSFDVVLLLHKETLI